MGHLFITIYLCSIYVAKCVYQLSNLLRNSEGPSLQHRPMVSKYVFFSSWIILNYYGKFAPWMLRSDEWVSNLYPYLLCDLVCACVHERQSAELQGHCKHSCGLLREEEWWKLRLLWLKSIWHLRQFELICFSVLMIRGKCTSQLDGNVEVYIHSESCSEMF